MPIKLAILSSLVPGSSGSGLLESTNSEDNYKRAYDEHAALNNGFLVLLGKLNLGEGALESAVLTDLVYYECIGIGVGSEAVTKSLAALSITSQAYGAVLTVSLGEVVTESGAVLLTALRAGCSGGTGSLGVVVAESLTFGSSTCRAGLGSLAGSASPAVTVCLAIGLAACGAYRSLGTGCRAAGVTVSRTLGYATYRTSLGSGAGSVSPYVAESLTLGSATYRTSLGSGAGSVSPIMAESLTLGSITCRTSLGSSAGSVSPIMAESLTLSSGTYRTGLGSGAGSVSPIMAECLTLSSGTYRTGLGSGASSVYPGVLTGGINGYGLSGELHVTYGTLNYGFIASRNSAGGSNHVFLNSGALGVTGSIHVSSLSGELSVTYGTVNYHIVAAAYSTGGIYVIFLNRISGSMSACANLIATVGVTAGAGVGGVAAIGTGRSCNDGVILVLRRYLSESAEVEHVIVFIKGNDLNRVLCANLKIADDVVVSSRVNCVFAVNVYDVLGCSAYSIPGKLDLAA